MIRRTKSRRRAPSLACTVRDGAAWIVLARDRVDLATAQALCTLTEELELDDRVAVVVLRGAGKAFCLGIEDGGSWQSQHDFVAAIGRLTRPVVAVVHGDAVAEGCELALACDLRIAASTARFSLPQIAAGYLPRHGGTQRLPRLIGRMRALDLLLTGRAVRGREAEAIGLATRVVPGRQLAAAARREVAALCAKGPIALRAAKEAVSRSLDLTLDQGIRLEQDLYVVLQTTADRAEGIRAFLAKRPPRFSGN